MEAFIGEDVYRKKNMINFFDSLVLCELRRLKPNSDLEILVLKDLRKLEKTMVRYIKQFNEPDPPNFLDLRYRSALLYHHYRWVQRVITLSNYEEMALVKIFFDNRDYFFLLIFKNYSSIKSLKV